MQFQRLRRTTALLMVIGAICATLFSIKDMSIAPQVTHYLISRTLAPHKAVPLGAAFALWQTPQLSYHTLDKPMQDVSSSPSTSSAPSAPPAPIDIPPSSEAPPSSYTDNGVPAQTVRVVNGKGFTQIGGVYIKNSSGKELSVQELSGDFAAKLCHDAPQVLLIHSHGSEAYSPEDYHSTGSYRTDDSTCSVVRVGDEIAATLSQYGISVLHDRVLYDDPLYDGAYVRSAEAMELYLEKYPSITYILDIHRDAVEDSDGNQYKLVCAEDETTAQLSFIMGTNHDGWEENLKLAIAVSENLTQSHPTLMRPITLRAANYNQSYSSGAMLVEVGAAGNSLDEAIHAGQLFAKGFAETIKKTTS